MKSHLTRQFDVKNTRNHTHTHKIIRSNIIKINLNRHTLYYSKVVEVNNGEREKKLSAALVYEMKLLLNVNISSSGSFL